MSHMMARMPKRLSEEFKHIVVVVGAGHRKDLEKMIKRGKL